MNEIKILTLLILAVSCSALKSDDPEKLYYKIINTPNYKIEWYKHSLITSTTSDYVVATDKENNRTDTICIADNIFDVQYHSRTETILLCFFGSPRRYMKNIEIPNEIFDCKIKLDTNHKSPGPTFRKTFKE